MKTPIYNVRDINEYWERLDKELEILIMHMLRNRYEFGTSEMCSESGIQQSLVHYAAQIAQNEGLNVIKTRCICQAVGLCFPEYGSIGLQVIKEYLADKAIDDVDINTLEIDAIEKKIYDSSISVTMELDEALHLYFDGSTEDAEVNVARFCHMKLQSARELMQMGMFAGDAITTVMEKATAEYDSNTEYSLEIISHQIPNQVRLAVEKNVKEALEWDGIDALYSYVL